MKRNLVKSGIAVATLSLVTVTGLSTAKIVKAEKNNSDENTINTNSVDSNKDSEQSIDDFENNEALNVLNENISTSSYSDSDKEETVYISTKSDGSIKNVIVSDWLKNKDNSSTLSDLTDLTNIENVKGYEEFIQNTDGSITWNSEGNDIYYQGKTSKELPISIKISYFLDGAEIPANEIAGKSGNITIRFDYINNSSAIKTINGEDTTIYTPFVTVTGMILPSDTFNNVKISNGKIISDGNNLIVVGIAMPGMSESLNLDNSSDISIPDYIEINADVNNFALMSTATIATPDLFSNINIDDIDSLKNLENSLNELTNASTQLVNGTEELTAGTNKLKSGSSNLYTGILEFNRGLTTAKSGADNLVDAYENKVIDGSKKLNEGLSQLNSAVSDLGNIELTISSMISELADKKSELLNSSQMLNAAISELDNQIQSGNIDASSALEQYKIYYSKLGQANGAISVIDELISSINQMDLANLDIDLLKSSVNSLSSGASNLCDGINQLYVGTKSLQTGLNELSQGSCTISEGALQLDNGISSLLNGAITLNNGMNTFNNNGIQKLSDTYNQSIIPLQERLNALKDLSDNYGVFSKINPNQKGTCKFIITTESISK